MSWLRRLRTWLFGSPLTIRLEVSAARIGVLTLQQIEGPERLYWTVSLRAGRGGSGRRYCWTAKGDSINEALMNVLHEARDYKIGALPVLVDAPKLGGREFDPPHVRVVPPPWED